MLAGSPGYQSPEQLQPNVAGTADFQELCDQCFNPVASRPSMEVVLKRLHS